MQNNEEKKCMTQQWNLADAITCQLLEIGILGGCLKLLFMTVETKNKPYIFTIGIFACIYIAPIRDFDVQRFG